MEIKISQIIISINYKIDLLVKMFAQIILYLKQNSWNGNFLRIATDLFDKPPLSPRICSGLSVGQARNKSMRKILKWRIKGVMLLMMFYKNTLSMSKNMFDSRR